MLRQCRLGVICLRFHPSNLHAHYRPFTISSDPPVALQKSISVAVLGAPNAGKSTLLNAIVGRHVSAVSPRAQTTRAARVRTSLLTSLAELIVGVTTRGDCQIVFYDSPGVLDLQSQRQLKLPRHITTAPAHAISQVDHALLVIDASSMHLALRKLALNRVLSLLKEYPQQHADGATTVQVTVALNKVDLVSPKSKVVPIVEDVKLLLAAAPHCVIDEIFMLCALPGRREGVDDLTQHLMSRARLQPWLHSKGTVSTSTLESVVVEMIRERLFYHIRQEVPYSCRVIVHECQKSEEESGRSVVHALASIVVNKSLHKSMVIGPSGSNIRKICQEAEERIALATGAAKAQLRIDVVSR